MSRTELMEKYAMERTPCETWMRVMGYLRNVNSFNNGKKSEAAQRVYFTEACACGK